jgi:Na+-transporting NADH:ubiquinone oxidoreductase subunit NqrC
MTTRTAPEITERVSRLEGAYDQVNERLRDLAESVKDIRSELGSLKTTIIVIGAGVWASTVGGFIALLVTD